MCVMEAVNATPTRSELKKKNMKWIKNAELLRLKKRWHISCQIVSLWSNAAIIGQQILEFKFWSIWLVSVCVCVCVCACGFDSSLTKQLFFMLFSFDRFKRICQSIILMVEIGWWLMLTFFQIIVDFLVIIFSPLHFHSYISFLVWNDFL